MTAADVHRHDDQLIATRRLDAEPSLVWDAFTTPAHLAAFWGGHHAVVPPESVSVDLQVGGAFELQTVGADGSSRLLRFRYEVIDRPTRLVLSEPRTGITTEILIEAGEAGTVVTVHQRKLPPELQSEQARAGLAGVLARLHDVVREMQQTRSRVVSAKQQVVDRYMDAFQRSDHEAVLACLTDDVVWHIHGFRTTHGKPEFDDEIENPAFEGSPQLSIDRTLEDDDTVVVTGEGIAHHRENGRLRFAYNDLFTFRNGLIAQVDSYVVPLQSDR